MKSAASITEAADLLCTDVDCIRNGDLVALCNAVCSMECKGSYGTAFFDHLAADGAGLTGGQVTVVAVSQIHTDLLGSLHLELIHGLLCLGNVDSVIALHSDSLLFTFFGKAKHFPKKASFLSARVFLPHQSVI